MNKLRWPFRGSTWFAIALAVVGTVCGCAPEQRPAGGEAPHSASVKAVTLRVVNADAYRKAISRLRGKVVLVDFWATWCAPCVEHFPDSVKLYQRYKDRGLAVVSVSLDDPAEKEKILEFLKDQGAEFANFLSEHGAGSESIGAFELPGAVPFYRIYDRTGKVHQEFGLDPRAPRQYTPADIEAAVSSLL